MSTSKQQPSEARCNIIFHEDTTEAAKLSAMICPLCKSNVRLYQLNYDEKLLLCSNSDCDFPFGYMDYHIFKVETDVEVVRSNKSQGTSVETSSITSGSTKSYSEASEFHKSAAAYTHSRGPISPLGPLSPVGSPIPSFVEHPMDIEMIEKIKKRKEYETKLNDDIKKIKLLNKQLYSKDENDCISNEKWIKTIAKMQERSGVQLLKDFELNKVKQSLPEKATPELKINIDTSGKAISVKIEAVKEASVDNNKV